MEMFMDAVRERVPLENLRTVRELEPGVTLERIGLPLETGESTETAERIWGNPEKDMQCWHEQSEANSCAVCCQEFIAEQLLDREFSETELSEYARGRGWYDPESGTPVNDTGKVLEALGLEVERSWGVELRDLAEELHSGGKIICGVNNMILADPEFARLPGLSANHAVEVIGIDTSDAAQIQVILNDPGRADGKGLRVSADTFQKAWDTSGNFAATVHRGGM